MRLVAIGWLVLGIVACASEPTASKTGWHGAKSDEALRADQAECHGTAGKSPDPNDPVDPVAELTVMAHFIDCMQKRGWELDAAGDSQ